MDFPEKGSWTFRKKVRRKVRGLSGKVPGKDPGKGSWSFPEKVRGFRKGFLASQAFVRSPGIIKNDIKNINTY